MKRQMTVLEYAYRKGGWRASQKALLFAVSWMIAEVALERRIERVEEYSAWWKQSNATSYRELSAFKKCFPKFDTPRDLFDALDMHPGDDTDKELSAIRLGALPVNFA